MRFSLGAAVKLSRLWRSFWLRCGRRIWYPVSHIMVLEKLNKQGIERFAVTGHPVASGWWLSGSLVIANCFHGPCGGPLPVKYLLKSLRLDGRARNRRSAYLRQAAIAVLYYVGPFVYMKSDASRLMIALLIG